MIGVCVHKAEETGRNGREISKIVKKRVLQNPGYNIVREPGRRKTSGPNARGLQVLEKEEVD